MANSILVVEDSIIVNKHIEVCLRSGGYNVSSAYNSHQALACLKGQQFELILLDIMLNDTIDGIELAEEIHKTYNVPVIYLTALSDKETIERAKVTQPYGYIIKPFNESELVSNIEVALHKSKFEREIKRNHDFLETVLDNIDESIIIVDEQNCIQYINPSTEQDLSISFKEVFKKNINDCISIRFSEPEAKEVVFEDLYWKHKDDLENEKIFITSKSNQKEIPIGDVLLKRFYNNAIQNHAIIFIFKDIAERLRKLELEAELRSKKLSLLIEGQELERARFSKEIHDGLGQVLNLIKMKIEDGNSNRKQNDDTKMLVEEALKEVRRISNNLLPSLLNDFDLSTCIRHLANQYKDLSKTVINVHHQDVPALSLNAKINAYRIVQEAINNAIKHGKAKMITIQMNGFDKYLQMTVEDDGNGFDIDEIQDIESHHGLQIMSQRVTSLAGEISIESDKRLGTMLTITIPTK